MNAFGGNLKMDADDLDFMLPQDCQNTYFDTWDRHNSIAFTTATKGLHNAPGENNCFVNSAVQVFWHLDVFRRSYRRLSGHTCMGNSCIFCALKVIFTQFQFSDQSSLHPDALRKALAETFVNQQRFQLGHMDDAAECFENILRRIHFHIASNCHEDTCTAPHCLPHQKFSLNIVEKVVCPCGASSNPLKFTEMVHYISAKALVSQARVMQETGDILHPDRFGLLLRSANAMGDIRDCPGGCGRSVQIQRTLLNSPDVVSIGLVWDSDHPTGETTTEVARNIGTIIQMQDVFHSVMQDLRTLPKLHLVGLVCYYGKHYSTFVFHSKLQVWIYFDDATVRQIGKCWDDVVDKCIKGRYQPLLLLYANPNASPVPVETAPKKRTMVPGYGVQGISDEESGLDRTHESISSQNSYLRSRTPNPESSFQPKRQTLLPRARSVTPSACEFESSGSSNQPIDHSRQQSFIMAVSSKPDKIKHALKFGGQASTGGCMPGSMTPITDQHDITFYTSNYSPQSSTHEDENYSDYTLSTSGQYKRPSMDGFEPARLPLTPNIKGQERKESFKKEKESIRADIVRYQVDPSRPQDTASSAYIQHQGQNYLGYETNQSSNISTKSGKASIFYQGREQPQFRQRSMSQDDNDVFVTENPGSESHCQHIIIKPMANAQNYDQTDGISQPHTAVQSGLATLPRKKKESSKDLMSSQRQDGLNTQSGTIGNVNSIQINRVTPNVLGRPPPVPDKYPMPMMADKYDGNSSKKTAESEKKVKKLTKKEMKKAEKKLKSEMSRSQPDLSGIIKPPLPLSNSSDSVQNTKEIVDEKLTYIDRRMVETILKHQGLQRNPSNHSTNSSSSIDSDSIMGRLLAAKHGEGGIPTDVSFDNVSLGSHKDSGYGSSDRNSSSSTGSGTIDPYIQYFISKSMVVPRNLNSHFLQHPPHQMVSDFSTPKPQVYNASINPTDGQLKDLSNMSKEEMSRHLYETLTQRKVMHPIKESSQEDILKVLPKEQSPSSTPVRGPTPLPVPDGLSKEGRPPPIPPKNFAAFQVSKSSHQREPSIDSLDKDEVENDYFVSMCEKADDLMDSCIIAETKGDLTAALRYCDSALGCLKEAMNQIDISNKALVYAQKKHNACLLKSRSLFKRTSSQISADGKRSSITSSGSDNSDRPMRRTASKEHLLTLGRGASAQVPGHYTQQDSAGNSAMKLPVSTPQQQVINAAAQARDGQIMGTQSSCAPYNTQTSTPNLDIQSNLSDQQLSHRPRSHVSRSSAADKLDSESTHSRSGSNSSSRSSASVPCQQSQASSQPIVKPHTIVETTISAKVPSSTPAPLDAYGTLPRNRQSRRTSDPTGKSDIYKTYLNRQKNVMNIIGSENSNSDGSMQKKINTEVKDFIDNNIVQKQMPQKQNNLLGDSRQQTVDMKSQQGQRLYYDTARQSENASNSCVGNNNMVSHIQSTNTYSGRTFHNNQAPSMSDASSQNQRNFNCPPTVSSVQSIPHSNSSPQLNSGSVQLLKQPHQRQQNFQSTVSQPGASQSSQHLSHNQHPHQQLLLQDHLARSTVQGQIAQPVSGYTQPLPGHRAMPTISQQNSVTNISSGNRSQHYSQAYCQPNLPTEGILQSQSIRNDTQQKNHSQMNSSQSDNQFTTSQTSSLNSLRTTQQSSVQNVIHSVQNLNINRKNSGGLPPPPPARTTSNPDFKQQLPSTTSQPQQQYQKGYHHPQLEQAVSSEVGSISARVQPNNSHADHHRSVNTESSTQNQYKQSVLGQDHSYTQGTQLKHATSTTGLNYITLLPRPLERYASQPDCQNLIEHASYSNKDLLPSSFAQGHMLSSNVNARSEIIPGTGVNRNFPQTSDAQLSQRQNGQNLSAVPNPDDDFQNQSVSKPNVRALASKFDTGTEKPAIKPKPSFLSLSRTRSRSESGSKKPKSVLKSKKNKNSKTPRKSVTFAEDFSNLAAGYESAAELTSFSNNGTVSDRAYYSDDDDNFTSKSTAFCENDIDDGIEDSNSDDTTIVRDELACDLCHKREIENGKSYCSKCSFYMSRLVQS